MGESVAVIKETDAKKSSSPTRSSSKSIHRLRNAPEIRLGSLGGVIGNIRSNGGKPSVESIAMQMSGMPTGERAPALLALQRTRGNRYVQRVVAGIQAKLVVGQPGDIYEREADRVADEVMRMPEPGVQRQIEPEEEAEELIQTKPLAEQITPRVHRQVEGEEIQTKQVPCQTPEVTPVIESSINSLRGGGQPLPESVRNYFEPRFGYDFSGVGIHTGEKASDVARALNSRAFALGNNIVFNRGNYSPGTEEGKKLIAHELTHVVQQTHGNRYVQRVVSGIQAKLVVGQPGGLYELEADRVVDEVMRRAVGKGTTQAEGQTASLTNTAPDNSQHPELPPPRKGETPLSYEHIEGKAFVRGVKPSDVKQLGLAACGLLAALSAVAAVNPEKILKSIRYRGGDQWDVLLYSKERTPVWITINQDLPVHVETGAMALVSGTEAELKQESIKPQYKNEKAARGLEASLVDPILLVSEEREKAIRQQLESMRTRWIITYGPDITKQELWPALYVKAVAILVAKYPIMPRRGSEPGGYDDLESIGQDVAIEIITGQPAQLIGSTEVSEDELFTVMNKAWLNDQPVTAGSLSLDGKKEGPVEIRNSGIYYDHSYTVLRTWKPEGNPVVDLRNPWGTRYTRSKLPKGNNNPEFRVGFREFKQLFDSVAIGNQRVETRLSHT